MKKYILFFFALIQPLMAIANDEEFFKTKVNGIYYWFNTADLTATVSYKWHRIEYFAEWPDRVEFEEINNDYSGDVVIPKEVTYNNITYKVTSIDNWAFWKGYISPNGEPFWNFGCPDLTSVTIPNSVTSIGKYAFYDCDGLTDIYCYSEIVPSAYVNSFQNPENITLHVPEESIKAYKSTEPWDKFKDYVPLQPVSPADDIDAEKKELTEMADMFGAEIAELKVMLKQKDPDGTAFDLANSIEKVADYTQYFWESIQKATTTDEIKDLQDLSMQINADIAMLADKIRKYEASSIFTVKTVEGVEMSFRVTSKDDKTCEVYRPQSNQWGAPVAIAKDTKGKVTIPEEAGGYKVTNICEEAFYYCEEITDLVIPATVTAIGERAICGCKKLTEINLPEGLTDIGSAAFYGTGLTKIYIPANVSNISSAVLSECYSLISIVVDPKNKTYDSRNNCNAILRTSNNSIIAACNNTVIPDDATSIGWMAFKGCNGLKNLVIPKGLTSIDNTAFQLCSGIETIRVENGNTVFDSRNSCNAIINTASNTLVLGCAGTVIPNSVTAIGENAFSGSSIKSVMIPGSVKTIYGKAFESCKQLTTVILPDELERIEYMAFMSCSALKNITIPSNINYLGSMTFQGCSNLESAVIPNGITELYMQTFLETGLKTITIGSGVQKFGTYAISQNPGLESVISLIEQPTAIGGSMFLKPDYTFTDATLYVPRGTKPLYQAAEGWNKFKEIIEIDLAPVNDDKDFADDGNGINENTDLSGQIIDDVYYNIIPSNGGFDPQEKCIVLNKAMTEEELEDVFGSDLMSDAVKQKFTGMALEVPAGKGKVAIDAQAVGGMTLMVKVGDGEPMEFSFDGRGKGKIKVGYKTDKPTIVYIYAGVSEQARTRGSEQAILKIYGISILTDDQLTGDVNGDGKINVADLVGIVGYTIGEKPARFRKSLADINEDAEVNTMDVEKLVEKLTGK